MADESRSLEHWVLEYMVPRYHGYIHTIGWYYSTIDGHNILIEPVLAIIDMHRHHLSIQRIPICIWLVVRVSLESSFFWNLHVVLPRGSCDF